MRHSILERNTKETKIKVEVNLDGKGNSKINLEQKFFIHMLTALSRYSFIDLELQGIGDDPHHLIEDVGIVMGNCIKTAVGDKKGIKRYGHSYIPMDEALVRVCIDISNRPFLNFSYDFKAYKTDDFETQNVVEFMRAFCFNMGATVHIDVIRGENDHHIIEAIFKAFGAALKEAVTIDKKIDLMSTKGII